jgi:hypothetical protein
MEPERSTGQAASSGEDVEEKEHVHLYTAS